MNVHYFIFVIASFNKYALAIDIKKIFYEKDLSEFCKRRVIPSIFLGRHVVEASAFVLHFTRLNLPYNCFISVRSESGSNMIMVITLPYNAGLDESCSSNSPQLLVYEMGETFGGYWGMLPEIMLSQKPSKVKFYTLKTTHPTAEKTEPSTEEYIETTTPTPTTYVYTKETQGFMRVDVPIVDVSGQLVLGSKQPKKSFDFEEAFDYQYDVTPIPGVKYDTSILPLVQLSVRKQAGDGRRDQEPRYELDVVEDFTPDARLTLPQLKSTSFNPKNKVKVNRRLKFAKNRATKSQIYKKIRITTIKNNRNQSATYIFPSTIKPNESTHARNSWEMIDMLMETLKKNKTLKNNHQLNTNNYTSRIEENISNMKHNSSIYLTPDLSIYNKVKLDNMLQFTTKKAIDTLPPSTTVTPSRKLDPKYKEAPGNKNQPSKSSQSVSLHYKTNNAKQESIAVTVSLASRSSSKSKTGKSLSSLLRETISNNNRHGSEMNIQTDVRIEDDSSKARSIDLPKESSSFLRSSVEDDLDGDSKVTELVIVIENFRTWIHSSKLRLEKKKRGIQSISIESDRPHNLTTMAKISTTTKGDFNVADMQEFAKLVELQDDNMHGRLSLRYMKQYVGPALYNICNDKQPFNRHVYLFNSSRIVLSLNNFTLSQISVIITAASTLLNGEMKCPESQLECQVSGARVCVDSMAACDGVPNCGSYDIYDEDRLVCGAAEGFRHNVYLAAFTFLIFLLTLFYAVHYWLMRCVPKVAEAFFVYTDGVENILYLDSIMRPPGDYDSDAKVFYSGNMENMLNTELIYETHHRSRFFQKCLFWFLKKEAKEKHELEHESEIYTSMRKKNYSFTQLELGMLDRPTVDTSVQTGASLEMAKLSDQITTCTENFVPNTDGRDKSIIQNKDPPIMIRDSLLTLDEPLPEDELNLMKFFRDSRSDSSESLRVKERYERTILDLYTGVPSGGEKELSSVMYDRGMNTEPGPSGVKVKQKAKPNVAIPTPKRIRFEEGTTVIPELELSDDDGEDDDDEDDKDSTHQRQVFSGKTRTWRNQHLSTIKEVEESGNKHFPGRHFWESNRKKSSKKANVNLRKHTN